MFDDRARVRETNRSRRVKERLALQRRHFGPQKDFFAQPIVILGRQNVFWDGKMFNWRGQDVRLGRQKDLLGRENDFWDRKRLFQETKPRKPEQGATLMSKWPCSSPHLLCSQFPASYETPVRYLNSSWTMRITRENLPGFPRGEKAQGSAMQAMSKHAKEVKL